MDTFQLHPLTYFEVTYRNSEIRPLKSVLLSAFPDAVLDTFVDGSYGIWSLSHENDTTFISMRRSAFTYNHLGHKCFIKTWEDDNSYIEADELEEITPTVRLQDLIDAFENVDDD